MKVKQPNPKRIRTSSSAITYNKCMNAYKLSQVAHCMDQWVRNENTYYKKYTDRLYEKNKAKQDLNEMLWSQIEEQSCRLDNMLQAIHERDDLLQWYSTHCQPKPAIWIPRKPTLRYRVLFDRAGLPDAIPQNHVLDSDVESE
jgi:hypothetical protein